MTTDHSQTIDIHRQHQPDRTQAPLWHEDDFVSGHVQTAIQYWRETILTDHPQRDEFLGYIGGVRLNEFIDPMSADIFEGSQFKGADVTPIELPNHVPTSHDGWVNNEIESLVQKGSLAAWSTVAGTKTQPRPRICLPLGVEPNKPRLIGDARYLNSMCKHFPFQMDGVGKVAQCSWKEAQQVTLDHKSGFHNVPLAPEFWEYFGLCWRGVYYVWTVLCFGWCASPYIYHSLRDAVTQYLRSQDIPTSAWLDDFWMTNSRAARDLSTTDQKNAAREAVALALTIFYHCGYFMVFPKCSLEPTMDLVFLGVGCDTAQRRFYVPEDKLRKLEAILWDAVDSRSISFNQLEKLAGKCTSMSVAVPPASLYTHHMYRHIAAFKRSGDRKNLSSIAVSNHSGLRFEMERWLEVRSRLNGAPWYDATRHVLTISGATDASSQAWGGLIRGPFGAFSVFKAAADFPAAWHNIHIKVKETFATTRSTKTGDNDPPRLPQEKHCGRRRR